MKICRTPLEKAVTLKQEPLWDDRGYFARSFCRKTLEQEGIFFDVAQCNVAYNHSARTLRGMHFQVPPFCEEKIVSCVQGAVYDVIIDLNRDSPTFCRWFGITLSAENGLSLYVPEGFAHGYQTLTDGALVGYMVSQFYTAEAEAGVRWNDPAFGIDWPFREDVTLSRKDGGWKDFDPETNGVLRREVTSDGCGDGGRAAEASERGK